MNSSLCRELKQGHEENWSRLLTPLRTAGPSLNQADTACQRCHCCPVQPHVSPRPRSVPVPLPGRAPAFVLQFDYGQLHSSLLDRFKISRFLVPSQRHQHFTVHPDCFVLMRPLIALTPGGKEVPSLTVVISMNFGYQDIQGRLLSSAFWTEVSFWAYLHSDGECSQAVRLANLQLYQQKREQEASHSQWSFLRKWRASPSLAGCKEIDGNVWAFQLPSRFRSSPLLQRPPWRSVEAHWIKLEEKQKTTLQENRPWIFLPKALGHAPDSSTQAGQRQMQAPAVWAADTGCGSPHWTRRGSLLLPNPSRSSTETERPSTWDCLKHQSISSSHVCGSSQTASTYFFYLKKSHIKKTLFIVNKTSFFFLISCFIYFC